MVNCLSRQESKPVVAWKDVRGKIRGKRRGTGVEEDEPSKLGFKAPWVETGPAGKSRGRDRSPLTVAACDCGVKKRLRLLASRSEGALATPSDAGESGRGKRAGRGVAGDKGGVCVVPFPVFPEWMSGRADGELVCVCELSASVRACC